MFEEQKESKSSIYVMCKREVEKEGVREVVGVSQDVAHGGVKARFFSILVLKELKEDD